MSEFLSKINAGIKRISNDLSHATSREAPKRPEPGIFFSPGDILIVRHAESQNNTPGENYVPDPHITQTGREQAEKLAELLKKNKVKFDVVVTSGKERTIETAETIINSLGLPIPRDQFEIDGDFRERDIGCYNLPRAQQEAAMRQYGLHRHSLSPENVWDDVPEDVVGLDKRTFETERQTADRFIKGIAHLQAQFPGKSILVVSHTRAMSSGLAELILEKNKTPSIMHVANTGYFSVRPNPTNPSHPKLLYWYTPGFENVAKLTNNSEIPPTPTVARALQPDPQRSLKRGEKVVVTKIIPQRPAPVIDVLAEVKKQKGQDEKPHAEIDLTGKH